MKLFQQLLVAPAALGLLAPVAATAAELNLDGVNKYAAEEQVTSISQFSDVKPTDWAYQALSNLIERYGCVAGYPGGTYKGGRAMTRFEAAALLNACLDRVSEVTDELKKLMAEFEKELAVLKGRVDGLEAKVGVLEAQQFSTTTKLKGIATMVLGGVTYGGDVNNNLGAQTTNGLSFNYDVRLNFDTSFTGKDLLRTTLRAGNFGNSAFFGNPVALTNLEVAFQAATGPNVVEITRLFYQFPIGSGFTATFGGRVRQDDMLAMWPSVYPADTILDFFTYAGSPQTYSLNLGAGAGLWWQQNGFSVSANYVSNNGDNGNPANGGIGNTNSGSTFTTQVGYAGNNWGAAVAYTYGQNYANQMATAFVNDFGGLAPVTFSTNNLALSAYWQPTQSGWIPSISAGWGIGTTNLLGAQGQGTALGSATLASWSVGLQWADAFVKGNALGMGFGQATYLTRATGLAGNTANDGNWAWEWWYKFQVTDNISVTPGFFYLSRPQGQATAAGTDLNAFGYLIKTTFKF
ncbi:MAG: porin [Cyanobacteria bacterium M_surface_9_m1_291]|nr:porin [Cyanobacteria bacterium M_surface_9_m1_291]